MTANSGAERSVPPAERKARREVSSLKQKVKAGRGDKIVKSTSNMCTSKWKNVRVGFACHKIRILRVDVGA